MPLESSSSTERRRLGRLGKPHGLSGFLGLWADPGEMEHLEVGAQVLVSGRHLEIRALRRTGAGFRVAFRGIDDRTAADELRGAEVLLTELRVLSEDEYWPEQLLGLDVFDAGGRLLGRVAAVEGTLAQDRLVIDTGEGSFEVPFVSALVPVVDLDDRRIVIEALPGLIEP